MIIMIMTNYSHRVFVFCIYICGGCILPLIIIDMTNYSQSHCVFGKHFSGSLRSKGVGDSHWWSRPVNISIWLFIIGICRFQLSIYEFVVSGYLEIKNFLGITRISELRCFLFLRCKMQWPIFSHLQTIQFREKEKVSAMVWPLIKPMPTLFFCRSGPLLSSFRRAHPNCMN